MCTEKLRKSAQNSRNAIININRKFQIFGNKIMNLIYWMKHNNTPVKIHPSLT